jgi:transposase
MEVYAPKRIKEKLPSGRQPKFTLEYMMMVARRVVEEKLTIREAAKLYGVSHGTISDWKKKYKKKSWGNAGKLSARDTSELTKYRFETQLKELKLEIGELYLENLMLKKILQHSQKIKRESSSIITSETLEASEKAVRS